METEEIVIYCFILLFGVVGFVLIQNHAPTAEAMGAWTFTGHELVAVIMPYIGYIYIVILLMVPVYKILREYK